MTALRLALTLARLFAAQTLRRLAVTAALLALALLFLLIGLAGLLAALWLWLARVLDPISAALLIGGAGVIMAMLLVLIARNRRPAPGPFASSAADDLQEALKDQKASLAVWAPLIALALIGFFLGRKPKD